jgi:hypothetical protein
MTSSGEDRAAGGGDMTSDRQPLTRTTEAVAEADRRQHIRVPGPFDGRRLGVIPIELRIYDLSQGGCFVNSVHEQKSGVVIVLEIDLPGEGSIRLKGQTLYAKPEFGFAVRFVEMNEQLSTRIERALRHIAELSS